MNIFGKELSEIPCIFVSQSIGSVPQFIVDAGEYIQQNLHTLGLFRKSASAIKLKDLKMRIDRGCGFDSVDPIHVACLIKLFLHELPQPLATFQLYHSFINIITNMTNNVFKHKLPTQNKDSINLTYHEHTSQNITQSNKKSSFRQNKYFGNTSLNLSSAQNNASLNRQVTIENLKNNKEQLASSFADVMLQLPQLHISTFIYLLDLLASVASQSDLNRMTEANLGICLAPAIFRQKEMRGGTGYRTRSNILNTADAECERLANDAMAVEMLITCAASIRRQVNIHRAWLCNPPTHNHRDNIYKSKDRSLKSSFLPTIYSGVNLLNTSAIELPEDVVYPHICASLLSDNVAEESSCLSERKRRKMGEEAASLSSTSNNRKRSLIRQLGERLFTPRSHVDSMQQSQQQSQQQQQVDVVDASTHKKSRFRRSIRGFINTFVSQKKLQNETCESFSISIIPLEKKDSLGDNKRAIKKQNKSFDISEKKYYKILKSKKWRVYNTEHELSSHIPHAESNMVLNCNNPDTDEENQTPNIQSLFRKKQTLKPRKNISLFKKWNSDKSGLELLPKSLVQVVDNSLNEKANRQSGNDTLNVSLINNVFLNTKNSFSDPSISSRQLKVLSVKEVAAISLSKNVSNTVEEDSFAEELNEATCHSHLLDCALSGSLLDLDVSCLNENSINVQISDKSIDNTKTTDEVAKESCDSLDSGVSMTLNVVLPNTKLSRNIVSDSQLELVDKSTTDSYNLRHRKRRKSASALAISYRSYKSNSFLNKRSR